MSKIRQNLEYYRTPSEIEVDIGPDNVSENFANANRIIGDVYFYIAGQGADNHHTEVEFPGDGWADGSDTGDGTKSAPFYTINRVMSELSDKIIDKDANVYVYVGEGIYQWVDEQLITHPGADRIQIIGGPVIDASINKIETVGTKQNVVDNHFYWDAQVLFNNAGDTSGITVGDWIYFKFTPEDFNTSGSAPYPERRMPYQFENWCPILGVHEVISVDSSTAATVRVVMADWQGTTSEPIPPTANQLIYDEDSNPATLPVKVFKTITQRTGVDESLIKVLSKLGYIDKMMLCNKTSAGLEGIGLYSYNGSSIICGGDVGTALFANGFHASITSTIIADDTVSSGCWTNYFVSKTSTINANNATMTGGVDNVQSKYTSVFAFRNGIAVNGNAVIAFIRGSSTLEASLSIWYHSTNEGISIGTGSYSMLDGCQIYGSSNSGIKSSQGGSVDAYWNYKGRISNCRIGINVINGSNCDFSNCTIDSCNKASSLENNATFIHNDGFVTNCPDGYDLRNNSSIFAERADMTGINSGSTDTAVEERAVIASGASVVDMSGAKIRDFKIAIYLNDKSFVSFDNGDFTNISYNKIHLHRNSTMLMVGATVGGLAHTWTQPVPGVSPGPGGDIYNFDQGGYVSGVSLTTLSHVYLTTTI